MSLCSDHQCLREARKKKKKKKNKKKQGNNNHVCCIVIIIKQSQGTLKVKTSKKKGEEKE